MMEKVPVLALIGRFFPPSMPNKSCNIVLKVMCNYLKFFNRAKNTNVLLNKLKRLYQPSYVLFLVAQMFI